MPETAGKIPAPNVQEEVLNMPINRRAFIGTGAAMAAALSAPKVMAAGHGKPRVVVVGGGAGGATAARYIAKDSKGEIDVTLVEPTRKYYTCFFSNLYLGGFRDIASIGHSYGT
jgi:cysteine synthase